MSKAIEALDQLRKWVQERPKATLHVPDEPGAAGVFAISIDSAAARGQVEIVKDPDVAIGEAIFEPPKGE